MESGSAAASHWDTAYHAGAATRSWHQSRPTMSLQMLDAAGVSPETGVVDVGGGASTFVDALIERGYRDLTVLDVSAAGLRAAQERLGHSAAQVGWVTSDILHWRPERTYGVWHDRAVFHFLVDPAARDRYLATMAAATSSGSVAVFGCFAPDGPERCSGLPVERYDVGRLVDMVGDEWTVVAQDIEDHRTPADAVQAFTWVALRRC